MIIKKTIAVLLITITTLATAQHDHPAHDHAINDTVIHKIPMNNAFSLHLPMSRNGSGTAWLPDSTPMFGYMLHYKKWMFMAHGNVFLRYINQDVFKTGIRGDDKVDAVNWFMFMGQRKTGHKGLFRFSSMFSLDNLCGGNGYPLLFQTGESWKGKPLVDRQHPHDLFSELSIAYTHAINNKTDVFLYAGYPGEPALGSVAFMHRVSSLYNPDAPLSHHWNDGTHITFGVLTAGIRLHKFKIDVSSFTGREPDENRNNFDPPRFDSYSGRLSFNPNPYWAFQLSQGFIKSPEATHPREDVYRSTASAVYNKNLAGGSFLSATALWGLNYAHTTEHAALMEASWVIKRIAVYGRYEFVQKSTEELNLPETVFGTHTLFPVNVITAGISYDVFQKKTGRIAIGTQASVYAADSRLNTLYGKNPLSTEIYLRFYPPRMQM